MEQALSLIRVVYSDIFCPISFLNHVGCNALKFD